MATKNTTTKAAPVDQPEAEQPVAGKPTTEQVTAIACALLQSPGYSIKLRDEQHQAHLVKTAMQIAEKINAAVNA